MPVLRGREGAEPCQGAVPACASHPSSVRRQLLSTVARDPNAESSQQSAVVAVHGVFVNLTCLPHRRPPLCHHYDTKTCAGCEMLSRPRGRGGKFWREALGYEPQADAPDFPGPTKR